jgi:hypothetical protein
VHIEALEAALVAAGRRCTATLGRASVATEQLLVALTLALAGTLYLRRMLRAQFAQRDALAEANRRWGLAADAAGIGLFEWHREPDRFVLDGRARAIFQLELRTAARAGSRRPGWCATAPRRAAFASSASCTT